MSRTKASFSHLQLSLLEGSVARKSRFHIINFHFLRDVSHESFVFTSSTFTFEGSLARKLRFHIFNFHFFREVSHESFVFTSSTFTFRRRLARKLRFHIFNFHFSRGSRTKASFSHLQLSLFADVSHESFVLTSSTCTF